MKILRYIPFLASLLLLSACSEDVLAPDRQPGVNDDGTITLDVSVAVPQMVVTDSRAMAGTPDYNGLQLYVVAFAMNDENDPTSNFYINNYTATNERFDNSDGMLHFDVTLTQTSEPVVLHLIAVPDGVNLKLDEYGSEELMARLTTTGNNDAYWQRVKFPKGFGTADDKGNFTLDEQIINDKLTAVPMIRNFAQVTVEENLDNFELEGFMIVNTPTAGTVAPWGSDMKFPEFIDKDKNQLDYNALSYQGILAGNAQFSNSDVTDGDGKYTTAPKFLFERPKSSINPTSVIIKGRYNGGASSYYKIDLGMKNATTGVFEIYNILRNFRYAVTITGVTTSGYATPDKALTGVTYNNLSFDVRTEKMLNISNGTAMLWVTQTTEVVTKEENRTFYFGYKFKENLTSTNVNNEDVGSDALLNTIKNLDVVESATKIEGIPAGYDATLYADYQFFEIKTVAVGQTTKTGSFVVVDKTTGLGRTINIVVSPPFEITRNRLFAGNYNVPGQFPYNRPTWEDVVKTGTGSPMTVFFTLDDELPEAIFPLVFEIEANPQDIENNPIGTLVVTSGESDFPELNKQQRIKYQKVVTWQNYNDTLSAEKPFGLIVPDKLNDKNGEKKLYIRRVRCRLRTINAGTNGQETVIRITNPYFKLGRWTKINWAGETVKTIEPNDIIEMTFKRTTSNVGENFTDWTSTLSTE